MEGNERGFLNCDGGWMWFRVSVVSELGAFEL